MFRIIIPVVALCFFALTGAACAAETWLSCTWHAERSAGSPNGRSGETVYFIDDSARSIHVYVDAYPRSLALLHTYSFSQVAIRASSYVRDAEVPMNRRDIIEINRRDLTYRASWPDGEIDVGTCRSASAPTSFDPPPDSDMPQAPH